MSNININREPCKETLHKIDNFDVGDVCIDTQFQEVMLIVSEGAVLSEAVDDFLIDQYPDTPVPPFDRLENCVIAVSLETGNIYRYTTPYRKVFKKVKSARLYVKE